ncbi:MAG: hypothetical protein EOP11_06640 [Proteobacteria bacterium]|nr:MAG: hypothetical protein EOP11_06640 [Pseudomonadota bacterium]
MQVSGAYDLIVIGDQLSGLFLAAGAAQMGLRVLVLEESSVATVSFEAPSGRLLGDFLAEPFIGLQDGSAPDTFLKSLGLYQAIDDLFPKHEPALQVVGRRMRLDFSYDPAELNKNLAKEFSREPARLRGLQRLLPGLSPEKSSFAGAVEEAGLEVNEERWGWLQSALYGSIADPALSYSAYKEILSLAARSVRYPLGGRSALRERLQARVKVYGGTIKRATRVDEIVFEKGKLAGVLLSSFEGFVRAPLVAGALGARTFFHLVPEEYRPAALRNAVAHVHPRFWRLSFTLLVPDASIPEGMGSHVALFGEEAGDQPLQLQVFPKAAYAGIPPGHQAIVVRALVPFEPETLGELAVSRALKRAMGRLKEVMPYLAEREFLIAPDPARIATDAAYNRYFRFKDLDFIPPSYLAFDAVMAEELGQNRYLDWSRFGLPGLALCSRDIYPLFGGTGEIMVAMDLLAILKKRRELR